MLVQLVECVEYEQRLFAVFRFNWSLGARAQKQFNFLHFLIISILHASLNVYIYIYMYGMLFIDGVER